MGGVVEETPSHEIARLENEKIALKFFENGVAFDIVRNSISLDMISDEKLNVLMEQANKQLQTQE